jgi:glutamyl-tRNA reductase
VSVVVIGLNHRTVPLELLERMTVSDAHLPKALADLSGRDHISEAVVLSTCNRTEIYASVERFHAAYQDIRDFLSDVSFLQAEAFGDHLYAHYDADAASHLFTVASGLDSAVIGESEIQGQVKTAWEVARSEGTAGPSLNLLFRHAVEVGKRVRTDTGISRNITSVATSAVAMARQRLGGLDGARILVLGAGDMGERMIGALVDDGAAEVRVANRTWDRSVELAERVGGTAIHLDDLPMSLGEVDLLLTSTGASSIMIEHGDLDPVMTARGEDRPLLIVDIAVPRDVDPAAADLPGITLLDMDDLRAYAQAGVAERHREAKAARTIVDAELERFQTLSSAREVAPLVATLRGRVEELRAAELAKHGIRLDDLDDSQREVVEAVTRNVLAKILHEPTVRLKEASGSPRGERLAESLRDLFDL